MPRYIDADALKNAFEEDGHLTGYIEESIDEQPTIDTDDMRGVVHCEDCRFWRRPPSCEGLARCETGESGIRYRSKSDFCSKGMPIPETPSCGYAFSDDWLEDPCDFPDCDSCKLKGDDEG